MNILITGGAGYVGSHVAGLVFAGGHRVFVLDDLSSGHRWAVPSGAEFVRGDVADRELVRHLIAAHAIDAVAHFAAYVVVPESVAAPAKYYRNNVLGSLNLIEECIAGGVSRFVFSSSAAVYGNPADASHKPIPECAPTAPINPYGVGKLMTEWMLRDLAAAADDFRFVALRYFNVAGAQLDGALGQATPNATHLIKVACEAACGLRDGLTIFGDDYATPDGTCIRDYIHVADLARAHLDAFAYLADGGENAVINCGYGRGYSVAEVVRCVKEVSGVDFPVTVAPRRAGDPPALVADNARIRERLAWQPQHDDLATICRTAYEWECALAAR